MSGLKLLHVQASFGRRRQEPSYHGLMDSHQGLHVDATPVSRFSLGMNGWMECGVDGSEGNRLPFLLLCGNAARIFRYA